MSNEESSGLLIEHLSYSYGKHPALVDITVHIEKGRFCALLGPNGAGKTTLFSLLTRLIVAPSGNIRISGADLRAEPRKALARMGIVFQQPTLDLDLTVHSNLTYYAALRGLTGREAEQKISKALDRLGMLERAGERAGELNGGHRRRTEIARALLSDPEILLLDEPTAGLDTASRSALTAHVHDLCAGSRLTVLWATHLVDEILPDDDLIVLHRGRVLAHDKASAVANGHSLERAFLDMTKVPA